MTERFGEDVFGGKQPKRTPEVVREELREKGVKVKAGVSVYIGIKMSEAFISRFLIGSKSVISVMGNPYIYE